MIRADTYLLENYKWFHIKNSALAIFSLISQMEMRIIIFVLFLCHWSDQKNYCQHFHHLITVKISINITTFLSFDWRVISIIL